MQKLLTTASENNIKEVIKTLSAVPKKDMTKPMQNEYIPKEVESHWYDWWVSSQFFHCDYTKGKPYVMLIPPPNVTGSLHVGHAMFVTIQDTICRWRRMCGNQVCWIPGTDHAGIATQSIVEKQLLKTDKLRRIDLGREKFLEKVWDWKHKYGNNILEQFKRLGASVDWQRCFFTMDEPRSIAITEAFCKFYDKGLIYRSNKLVNWCCYLQTAISDIEIESEKIDKPTKKKIPGYDKPVEFGYLTHFAYKIKGTDQEIVVATTRLETMLGDVAVAVHPNDERYKALVGKELVHPFFEDRKMVLIADGVLVDMAFGTGAVKVTPAHDQSDYECGERNKLPKINILNSDGTINHNGGKFKGQNRFECREKIYKELEAMKLIRGKTPNPMVLSLCQRSGDILEPMIKPQWWMNCKELAAKSVEAVEKKELTIIPESFNSIWYQWLKNIKEWCVSRQLWWGHRIPAYLCQIEGVIDQPDSSVAEHWIVARNITEAYEKACKKYNVPKDKIKLSQDEDVLDTWFSSGLLPFTSLGWPEETIDMQKLFPTDILETGSAILFFWVARMVMMSLGLTSKLPFKTILLHQLVMDREGKKMSKSKGNVVDPIEIIQGCQLESLLQKLEESNLPKEEVNKGKQIMAKDFPSGIPECGIDALRFGLMSYLLQGRSINLDILRVIGYRHFCNKLWNATKFALSHLSTTFKYLPEDQWTPTFIDQWILNRLNLAVTTTNKALETYNFGDAASALYEFWLYDFCDVYLEAVKPVVYAKEESKEKETAKNILYKCLSDGLKLLHPIMPFITEELYHRLPVTPITCPSICIAQYPTYAKMFDMPIFDKQMNVLMGIVKTLRSSMASLNIPKKDKPNVFVHAKNEEERAIISKNFEIIVSLAKIGKCLVVDAAHPENCVRQVASINCDIYLEVKGLIDAKSEVINLYRAQKLSRK